MKFASYKGDVSPSELNLYEEHTLNAFMEHEH